MELSDLIKEERVVYCNSKAIIERQDNDTFTVNHETKHGIGWRRFDTLSEAKAYAKGLVEASEMFAD